MTEETAAFGESAEELTEKSRLKSLFSARNEAAEAIRQAPLQEFEVMRNQRENASPVIDEYVRSAVTAYVLECEPLFKNTQVGLEYWNQYQLEPIAIPLPPDEMRSDDIGSNVSRREIVGVPDTMIDGGKIGVTGIRSFVRLPSPIKIRWIGYDKMGFTGATTPSETTTMGIPRGLSESVFRATNSLLADLDIGLDAEKQSDGEASYDYSDLL